MTEHSRSILRANFGETITILPGSSFVATSAPKRYAGMRLPRALMHSAVQAIVSPKTLSRSKADASRAGSVTGKFTGALRLAGPLSFFQASQILTFIARKIFGAKYKKPAMAIRKITRASTGLK